MVETLVQVVFPIAGGCCPPFSLRGRLPAFGCLVERALRAGEGEVVVDGVVPDLYLVFLGLCDVCYGLYDLEKLF